MLRRTRLVAIRQRERTPRKGHELVDDQFGFASNSIYDVVDADRAGNVVDEVDQPPHTDQRKQHRPCHGRDGHERVGNARAAGNAAMQ